MKLRLLQTLLIAAVLSPGLGVATNLDTPITKKDKVGAPSTCASLGNLCTELPCCPGQGLTCNTYRDAYTCCLGQGKNANCDSGAGPLLKK